MESQKTLLIVDDNHDILEYLSTGFSDYGFNIITAENGKAALSLLKTNQPAFALIDIRLPDINGIDLSKQIYASFPQVIIILMTGYPDIREALKNLENRVFDYLIKPFKFQQLLLSLKRAAKYSELMEQNNQYKKKIELLEDENNKIRREMRKLLNKTSQKRLKELNKPQSKNKYLNSYKKQQDYSD
ncbi:MAG: response regulator [Candidatus Marinimicrobia bacterium]|nr:response regulator [Candidatus Neomarinimicrobiota bacterium]